MADLGTARPVSGEMMAAAGQAGLAAAVRAEVIDADYVEVEPERWTAARSPAREAGTAQPSGMAMLKGGIGGAGAATRGGPLFWLAGAVVAGAAFWIAGGHAVLRDDPASAVQDFVPQLTISDVRSRAAEVEGRIALLVDGVIRNDGELSSGPVPALIVQVVSTEGRTMNYRLGTLRTPLAPGAKYGFSSRLDMPKDGVKTVTVSFDT